MLTGCGESVQHGTRPVGAQCARTEAAIRQTAHMVALFTGVITSRQLAEAERKLERRTLPIATGANAQSYLLPMGKREPLSRELRLVEKDYLAFWIAWAATRHSGGGQQAVGAAARKTMGDIQTVRATCAVGPDS
jgi:hypothetical protein